MNTSSSQQDRLTRCPCERLLNKLNLDISNSAHGSTVQTLCTIFRLPLGRFTAVKFNKANYEVLVYKEDCARWYLAWCLCGEILSRCFSISFGVFRSLP